MDPKLKEILDRLADMEGKAASLAEKLEAGAGDEFDQIKADLKAAQETIADLRVEKEKRERDVEIEKARADVKSMREQIDQIRTPLFNSPTPTPKDESPYAGGKHSFFADVKAAQKGNPDAYSRLQEAYESLPEDVKAMTEGTESAGGYLVNPEISAELIRLRLAASVVRQRCSQVSVQSDSLQIASITGGLTAGWVAELAAKPEADMTFGSLTVNVFTLAGLAAASNQLLADARPSVDRLIVEELARRIAILEEQAIINGDASGKPRGILQTAGIGSTVYTDASPTAPELLDAIYASIVDVQTDYIGEPDTILMHPRIWSFISTARGSDGFYVTGGGENSGGRRASDGLPDRSLFGVPVVLSSNVPTNLGAGTNESAVIVGNFREALILDRQGFTVDTSEHVRFTTNQTMFRGEARMGFTAARYPKAFSAVTGTGLILA
jgi:HK97 family phage major capsid protein